MNNKPVITISHSGDYGDVLWALPAMRELGYFQIAITHKANTRQNLLEENKWQNLQRLLESQDYIDRVYPDNDVHPDYNFDKFRPLLFTAMQRDYSRAKYVNLTTWQCIPFNIDPSCQLHRWLNVDPNPVSKYVINKTDRYGNEHFPWKEIVDALQSDLVFVGTPDEHRAFINSYGPVNYFPTDDLLDLAQVIKGSEWFIGNQSCAFAIAEGMKHNAILCEWPMNPNCRFQRDNVVHCLSREPAIQWLDERMK